MAQDGKILEKLVNIVEEVYRSTPETEILANHKITNIDGDKREFDLIIRSEVNSFPLTVAIECKQYAEKVGVEKIEAFYTKCLGVPEISKKVFIAEKGFQKGAVNTAKRYGIDLYTFGEITQKPRQILPVVQRMKPIFYGFDVLQVYCVDNPYIDELKANKVNVFKSVCGTDTFDYYDLIKMGIEPKWPIINMRAIKNWMGTRETKQRVDFAVNFEEIYFEYKGLKIPLTRLECAAKIELHFIKTNVVEKSYINLSNGQSKADTLTFTDENIQGSIVIDKQNNLHIYNTSGKQPQKLEVLMKFNSETGEFEKPDKSLAS